jgi:hypothetical protein
MTEFVEPSQFLIKYLKTINDSEIDLNYFSEDEWCYIQSDLETNIFLFKRIDEIGILPDEINACDCGIGLGTVLFDLYLQSKEFPNKKFTFTGIEKYKKYIDFFNDNLIECWNGELNLIHGDIMDQNYSKYNFIYFYQPFKNSDKSMNFYSKIIKEAPKGAIIIGLDDFKINTYGDSELIDNFNKLNRSN